MKKWLRWWGIGAFVSLTLIIFGLWFFFVDSLVKRTIEDSGSRLVGARVELGRADLSLFPAGLSLYRLQVTNPDKPMENAVEITRIACSIDLTSALLNKITINEMTLDGVRFDTPRKTSGKIKQKAATPTIKKKISKALELPSFKLPDVKEILEKEDLKSLKLIASVRNDIDREKIKWQKRLKELPDKDKLKDYERRIKGLKSIGKGGFGGILSGFGELVTIKKELEKDLKLIKTARHDLDNGIQLLQKRIKEAEAAPVDDVRRLKEKYALSPQGLANITKLLLGEKIGNWTQTALSWYDKLKPFLERSGVKQEGSDTEVVKPLRGKGVYVRFKERHPTPDFLIRKVRVTRIETRIGALSGKLQNITPDQDVLGLPLSFVFTGDSIKDVKSLKFDGTLNHIVPEKSRDSINFSIKGYQARNIILSDSKDLPLSLQKGLADINLKAGLSHESITARLVSGLTSTKFSVGKPDATNPIVTAISSAISDVSKFNLTADISGTIRDYDIKLKSNLDSVLQSAVKNLAGDQAARLEKGLTAAITKKAGGPLNEL